MRTISFYGHSDDCFEIRGERKGEPDEIGCYGTHVVVHLKSATAEQRLAVFGIYSPDGVDGTWVFGVGQIAEDDEVPPWPISISREHGYSLLLTIECPDDTTIRKAGED